MIQIIELLNHTSHARVIFYAVIFIIALFIICACIVDSIAQICSGFKKK